MFRNASLQDLNALNNIPKNPLQEKIITLNKRIRTLCGEEGSFLWEHDIAPYLKSEGELTQTSSTKLWGDKLLEETIDLIIEAMDGLLFSIEMEDYLDDYLTSLADSRSVKSFMGALSDEQQEEAFGHFNQALLFFEAMKKEKEQWLQDITKKAVTTASSPYGRLINPPMLDLLREMLRGRFSDFRPNQETAYYYSMALSHDLFGTISTTGKDHQKHPCFKLMRYLAENYCANMLDMWSPYPHDLTEIPLYHYLFDEECYGLSFLQHNWAHLFERDEELYLRVREALPLMQKALKQWEAIKPVVVEAPSYREGDDNPPPPFNKGKGLYVLEGVARSFAKNNLQTKDLTYYSEMDHWAKCLSSPDMLQLFTEAFNLNNADPRVKTLIARLEKDGKSVALIEIVNKLNALPPTYVSTLLSKQRDGEIRWLNIFVRKPDLFREIATDETIESLNETLKGWKAIKAETLLDRALEEVKTIPVLRERTKNIILEQLSARNNPLNVDQVLNGLVIGGICSSEQQKALRNAIEAVVEAGPDLVRSIASPAAERSR